jgi:hypothetical protein
MPAVIALHEEPGIEARGSRCQKQQPRQPSPKVRLVLRYQVKRSNRQKDRQDDVGGRPEQAASSIVVSAVVHAELLDRRARAVDPSAHPIESMAGTLPPSSQRKKCIEAVLVRFFDFD